MLKKLQIKIAAIIVLISSVLLTIIFCLIYSFTQRSLETESIGMMRSIAASPFQMIHPDDSSQDLKLPFFVLQLDMSGSLTSASGGYYDLSDQDFLNDLISKTLQKTNDTGVLKEQNLRYLRMKLPMGTVLVFSDMSSEKNTLMGLRRSFIIIGLAGFVIIVSISIILSKWAIHPVVKNWNRQKQFIADASHELKTPLTVIITNTELLQSPDYSEEDRSVFLQSITLMSGQMKLLVEKMLLLAKSDNRNSIVPMRPFDFSALVLNVSISFEGVFIEKNLYLESHIESGIMIRGNVDYMQQVITILLDNAQKYSSEHGTSHIALYHLDRKRCCLKVSSPGLPIPSEELKSIFRRFYRIDKARSRNGSFGLGLSIAESIVTMHKGKIWAESHNGINSFYVELKRIPSSNLK